MGDRHNTALRGHRDSGRVSLDVQAEPQEGNFKALLRFSVASGDTNLGRWVVSAPANATHTSWETQNEMIQICGKLVSETIVRRVHRAGIFSVIADETTDVSTKQQLAICVRYVDMTADDSDATPVVREDVVALMNPSETTGRYLAAAIMKKQEELSLELRLLRG